MVRCCLQRCCLVVVSCAVGVACAMQLAVIICSGSVGC